MGKDKSDKVIMRHILEVRLAKRSFSFMDYKGELIDFLATRLSGANIRYKEDGSRIDIATKDLSRVFFVSYENLGLQLDGVESFRDFTEFSKTFLETIDFFKKYDPQSISRIGTRSSILFHSKKDNIEDLKQRYKDGVFTTYRDMEEKTESTLFDLGFSFDLKRDDGIASIVMGPATIDEIKQKVFTNKDLYNNFGRKDGLFFDIDLKKDFKDKTFSIKELLPKVTESIIDTEKIFNGLLGYFNIERHGN